MFSNRVQQTSSESLTSKLVSHRRSPRRVLLAVLTAVATSAVFVGVPTSSIQASASQVWTITISGDCNGAATSDWQTVTGVDPLTTRAALFSPGDTLRIFNNCDATQTLWIDHDYFGSATMPTLSTDPIFSDGEPWTTGAGGTLNHAKSVDLIYSVGTSGFKLSDSVMWADNQASFIASYGRFVVGDFSITSGGSPTSRVIGSTTGAITNITVTFSGLGSSGYLNITNLPPGLVANTCQFTGIACASPVTISGTPSQEGTFDVGFLESDVNQVFQMEFLNTLQIVIGGALTPSTLNISGTAGSAITPSTAFTATNFTGAVSYAVTSGTLPTGLSLSPSTGVVSGTPMGISTATVTITATGATAGTATATITFAIAAAPVVTPATQTVSGTASSAITPTTAFTATNFTGAVSYAVTTGVLPAGLSLSSSTGVVSGTPTAASTATVTITATGATAGAATATITFAIAAAPVVTPATQTVSGTADTAITASTAFTATNFTGAVSFAVTTGTLPAGLSLSSSTGVVSGTPTAASTATVTITATGATAGTATATITFVIVAAAVAPVVTTPTPAPVAPVVTTPTTVAPAAPTTTLPAAPELVTSANQARLEAAPGGATAIVNGKVVAVETIKVDAAATNEELEATGQNIVDILSDLTPSGEVNPVKLVTKSDGPVLTGLIVNPDDPTEKLDAPVESVTLVKTGDTAVLISAVNQTNLPSAIAPSGAIEVTRGGVLAARSYGLPSLETGEIVLMSTPRLLQKFTVDQSGSYSGQVVLPRKIALGSHTVVMATSKVKVSLGITLVATKLMFRTKTVIGTKLFQSRAGVKKVGGVVTVKGAGRCKAKLNKITMSKKPGRCFITVKQAAKGSNKAVYSRFTVAVVKKLPKTKKK